jgi:glutamate 5-kinase
VVDVQGTFESGEAVVIRDTRGEEVARGISRYPSVEVVHIKGSRSPEVARLLGVHAPKEIVHRDNLILSGPG